jgi:GNAT superfamily N-acetyltransferase
MTNILEDFSTPALLAAIDANHTGYYLRFGRLPEGEVHEDATITWFASGVQDEMFNGVTRARLDQPDLDRAVESVLAQFRRRNVPMVWHIGPASSPATLGSTLLAHGLFYDAEEPGMALDLLALNEGAPPPTGLTIEPVVDEPALRQWVAVWAFDAPESAMTHLQHVFCALGADPRHPWRYYLGRLHGEPVATVKLFYHAGVVSVQHVVTLPHARRRGISTAITAHALRQARDLGYRIAMLTASPHGIGNYRRIGFQEFCTFRWYRWRPETGAT